MARVQITIPDDDRDRFLAQAKREGMTLSAWLRVAAHERLKSPEEPKAFFRECNAKAGPGREPDWEEHLAAMHGSRLRESSTRDRGAPDPDLRPRPCRSRRQLQRRTLTPPRH